MELINPAVLARANHFADCFRDAKPFRHVVIDGFLDPALCQRLLDDFPRFEDRFALNELGQVGGKAVRMDVRDVSAAYHALDQGLQSRRFLEFVSAVTGIPDLLYDPDYVGGGTHENRDGQGLDPHVDFNYHPRTKTHRRLNLIVYLNPEWEDAWGGALELHSDPWNDAANRTERVLPQFNRAVVFETNEISWHGFDRIELPQEHKRLSRKSFAIYLYTKERPAQEAAPPHATIYVPAGLPPGLAAGQVLDAGEVAELQSRFTRLRAQLRYLYDREKHFGAQLAAAEGALAEARSALRVPLQGYALQAEAPVGMWTDGWIGREFSLRFTPQKKMRGIDIDLWVPRLPGGTQLFDIECGGARWQHSVASEARTTFTLEVSAAAAGPLVLSMSAAHAFVPAQSGESGDDRALAWRLLGMSLAQ